MDLTSFQQMPVEALVSNDCSPAMKPLLASGPPRDAVLTADTGRCWLTVLAASCTRCRGPFDAGPERGCCAAGNPRTREDFTTWVHGWTMIGNCARV
jgi:hypothetical protein